MNLSLSSSVIGLVLALPSIASAGDELQVLTAADGRAGQGFGFSLDLAGDRLAVGAPWDDDLGPGAGAVYLFERQAGVWVQTLKLHAFDGVAGDGFGWDVGLDGDLLAVSVRQRVAGSVQGVVEVYGFDGTSWAHQVTLVEGGAPPHSATQEMFGLNVKVAGGRVAVRGNYRDEYDYLIGSFFVFGEDNGVWGRELRVDGFAYNRMGFDAETLIAGNTAGGNLGPFISRGWANVYDHDVASDTWVGGGGLHGDAAEDYDDQFASGIAAAGDRIAVAANTDTNSTGAVYLFRRIAGVWEREARLVPLIEGWLGVGERSLGLSDSWMVMRRGGALVFRLDGGEWVEDHWIPTPPGAGAFGQVIRVAGSTAAIGAYQYDGVGADSGAVFVYGLEPLVDRYCTSTPNSSGEPARIDVSGSMSIVANDAQLLLSGAPAGVAGIFFYGQGALRFPVGNGYACLDPGLPILRRYPIITSDSDGSAQLLLDFPSLPAGGAIAAGSEWHFQCYFRDMAAGGSGFNMTDAVSVYFLP